MSRSVGLLADLSCCSTVLSFHVQGLRVSAVNSKKALSCKPWPVYQIGNRRMYLWLEGRGH